MSEIVIDFTPLTSEIFRMSWKILILKSVSSTAPAGTAIELFKLFVGAVKPYRNGSVLKKISHASLKLPLLFQSIKTRQNKKNRLEDGCFLR